MFGAIALEFELKFACFLEIFILNKAVSKLQATQNFWWYSKRRVTFQTQDNLNEKFIGAFFSLVKKGNKGKLQVASQFWYICLGFLLKIYQKQLLRGVLLNRCCLRKHIYERLLINYKK